MNEIETIFQKSSTNENWINQDSIKLPNRAMNFGDGLFETMLWNKDNIRFFEKHLFRLHRGMKVLGLEESSINSTELISLLQTIAPGTRKRVRWNVFRSGAGKYTPESAEVLQTLYITEFIVAPSIKSKVDVSFKVRLFPTLWSSFKSLNSLPYVLANNERISRGLDEIILLDYRGFISEAGASNIFWIKDGTICTPSLSCSCIDGVSRRLILEHLDQNSLPYLEGEFELSELENAEQVFVSNCTGFSFLESLGKWELSTEPISFLREIFD
ncbi:aminotransferase class IV [Algoriphagus ratkowskyi]|nr:aminotransferase class IV [Algoriphagus ratkowskyi]